MELVMVIAHVFMDHLNLCVFLRDSAKSDSAYSAL